LVSIYPDRCLEKCDLSLLEKLLVS
jgi:hypothetical protein